MSRKILKVRSLMLYDGYAEVSTWGCVLMHHPAGFSSLQEALTDLNRLTKEHVDAEYERELGFKYLPKQLRKKETVTEFIRTMIRGDFQDSSAWDAFCESRSSRWQMAQNHFGFDWKNRVEIANSPELIANAPYWLEKDPSKYPTDDPDVQYEADTGNGPDWKLTVISSYCDFANAAMSQKMFLGGYKPKRSW